MIHTLSLPASLILYLSVFTISSWAFNLRNRLTINGIPARKVAITLILIFPVLLGAMRYNVGSDFQTYSGMYDIVKNISFGEWIRNTDFINGTPTGMYILSRIANLFDSEKVFFGLTIICIFLPIVFALLKDWNDIPVELAAFVFLTTEFPTNLNIIKQGIAISLIFWGFKYIYDKKYIKYLLVIFVAFIFHQTAIIAVPLYFLWNKHKKVSILRKIISLIICVLVIFFMNTILEQIGGYWSSYIDSEGTSNQLFFLNLIWLVVFLFFYKPLVKLDKRNDLLIFIYLIGVVFTAIGFWSVFGKRIANYFTIVQIILIPQLTYVANEKSKKIVRIGIILYAVALFIYMYMYGGHANIFPYQLIF